MFIFLVFFINIYYELNLSSLSLQFLNNNNKTYFKFQNIKQDY